MADTSGSTGLFAQQVPLMRPWLDEEEALAVRDVILSGWVSLGPKVAEFEEAVARLVGARHGVATNSATSAMYLAFRVAGIEPGDEVICPSFTCMATANAILMIGAVPRFADIERHTYNLSVADVEARITERTRAVLVVDQIGLAADLDPFLELCSRRSLLLIEDAATAFGGRYKNRFLGGWGVPTCYSFHPRKMITTGEGGMLMTDDAAAAEKARIIRSAGASVSDLERHKAKGTILQVYEEAGFNFRFTDIQAAIGLVQLSRLSAMLEQRTAQAKRYDQALGTMDEVSLPEVPDYAVHSYSSYCVRLRSAARLRVGELVPRMAELGVSCRHGIQPLHHEPYFRKRMPNLVLPETESAAQETMFLPIFPGMTGEQQQQVIDSLKFCLRSS